MKTQTHIPAQSGAASTPEITYHAWELHRYEYNGTTIQASSKGCGQDIWPEIHNSTNGDTYSTYVPINTFDNYQIYPLTAAPPIPRANIIPGYSSFDTPEQTGVTGIKMTNPEDDSQWPSNPNLSDPNIWDDTDQDGELGSSLWSIGPSVQTRAYYPAYYQYTTTDAITSHRAACWSVAARVKRILNVAPVTSCATLTGAITTTYTRGHIRSCTRAPSSLWEDRNPAHDIKCDATYWASSPTRCNSTEISNFDSVVPHDDTADNTGTTVTFRMIKVKSLSETIPTCAEVRATTFP
jgi:hypothetical protein